MTEKKSEETLTFYPFAYVLLDDELSNYCWYCLSNEHNILRCTGCQVAHFCDKACLSLAWKDHKVECKAWSSQKASGEIFIPNVEIRMLGRVVVRYKMISEGKDTKIKDFYLNRTSDREIMELSAHEEDMTNDAKALRKFQELHEQLKTFYGSSELTDEKIVFKLHCRNYINRHAISDKAYLKEIGKGLYLDLCAYDHSCRPNVIYSCRGFAATLRPLSPGINILDRSTTFYSYIDLLCHKEQRQKMLKESWYFHCRCQRCVDEKEHILTSVLCSGCSEPLVLFGKNANKDAETLSISCAKCLEVCRKERIGEAISAMRFLDGIFERGEIDQMESKLANKFVRDLFERFRTLLPKVNIYYVKLVQVAIRLCNPKDTMSMLQYHMDATECMRVCFPENHPALAYHLMNIGIFYCQLGRKNDGLPYLNEAKEMIEFVLTSQHPMLAQIHEHL